MTEPGVMIFDTDYLPKLSDIELNGYGEVLEDDNPKKKFILVLVPITPGENNVVDDHYVAIVADNEENRKLIKSIGAKIVGEGTTTLTLAGLLYGLQHPTRLMYKDTIAGLNEFYEKYLKDKFTSDDAELRAQFNEISDN